MIPVNIVPFFHCHLLASVRWLILGNASAMHPVTAAIEPVYAIWRDDFETKPELRIREKRKLILVLIWLTEFRCKISPERGPHSMQCVMRLPRVETHPDNVFSGKVFPILVVAAV